MKYLHTLDPDDIRELEKEMNDYWETVAELAEEDAAMERYYNERYNQ